MPCLEESTIFGLAMGILEPARRAAALRHVATCDTCRELAAETVKSLGVSATIPAASSEDGAEFSAEGAVAVGSSIGRYRIGARLGVGAMGVVYAADDAVLGRRVALKFLRAPLADDARSEPFEARLAREARAMARLSHPNVVSVYDLGRHDGRLFVAMELVEGCTLTQWLSARERSARAVLDVFLAAGRGLAAAHAAGVVHRDVKPDNILVGADGRARVTDFGLARAAVGAAATGADAPTSTTHAGAIVGTPAYMAPEQLRGLPADQRSDQYGFAVSIFEALHTERPFAGNTIDALLNAIEQGRVRPQRRASRVPRGLRSVLLRALRPRPEERYASMDEMVAALERAARRPRAALVGAALGALGVLGAAGVLIAGAARGPAVGPTRLRECRGVDRVCGSDEFCQYQPSNVCGAAELPGVCRPRPTACPSTGRLSCGCDGKTYAGPCDANREGVPAAYAGPCVSCDRASGEVCGVVSSAGRRRATFCSYSDDDPCGAAGSRGVCRPRPGACPDIDAPVCGCDGRDYPSGCEAARTGVGVARQGRCGG